MMNHKIANDAAVESWHEVFSHLKADFGSIEISSKNKKNK